MDLSDTEANERMVIRYAFSFWQSPLSTDPGGTHPADALVYSGDQTAVFFKDPDYRPEESPHDDPQ